MNVFVSIDYLLHKRYIERVRAYLEGNISEDVFFRELSKKRVYRLLYKKAIRKYLPFELMELKLIDVPFEHLTVIDKIGLQSRLCTILDYYNIKYKIRVPELALWNKWENYIPSYLDCTLELIETLEKLDPNKEHTKKWHFERFKKEYPYEKYPPRWLQNCEWPVNDDGKRCLFLYQTGFPNRHDFIEYHFRDSNRKEIVIEQYI